MCAPLALLGNYIHCDTIGNAHCYCCLSVPPDTLSASCKFCSICREGISNRGSRCSAAHPSTNSAIRNSKTGCCCWNLLCLVSFPAKAGCNSMFYFASSYVSLVASAHRAAATIGKSTHDQLMHVAVTTRWRVASPREHAHEHAGG